MKGLENNAAELFRLMDRVRKAWQSVTPCEHLSKSQFGTLMAIAHHGRMPGQSCTPSQEHGALTLTALAGAMHQSLPALSQRVSALEAQGYVERVPDPDDRRVIGVCVTPEGRTVMEVAYRRFGSILSRSIDYLGPKILKRFCICWANWPLRWSRRSPHRKKNGRVIPNDEIEALPKALYRLRAGGHRADVLPGRRGS